MANIFMPAIKYGEVREINVPKKVARENSLTYLDDILSSKESISVSDPSSD